MATLHADTFEEKWSEESFRSELAKPTVLGLGAFEKDALLAFVLIQFVIDQSEILTLGTAPASQRQGLATQLVRYAARTLLENGISQMILDVAEDNDPARQLYERLGFTVDGRRNAYYKRLDSGPKDAILMSCPISDLI